VLDWRLALVLATVLLVVALIAGWIPPNVYTIGFSALVGIGSIIAIAAGRRAST
jgi:hypothetical protein